MGLHGFDHYLSASLRSRPIDVIVFALIRPTLLEKPPRAERGALTELTEVTTGSFEPSVPLTAPDEESDPSPDASDSLGIRTSSSRTSRRAHTQRFSPCCFLFARISIRMPIFAVLRTVYFLSRPSRPLRPLSELLTQVLHVHLRVFVVDIDIKLGRNSCSY